MLGAAAASGNAMASTLQQGLQEVIAFWVQQNLAAKLSAEANSLPGVGAPAAAAATAPGGGVGSQPVPGAELSQQAKDDAAKAAADLAAEQQKTGAAELAKRAAMAK